MLCSDSADIGDKCIFRVANMCACIYNTGKVKPDLEKSEFSSPNHYCAIFIFRINLFMVQFSDHLPLLNARINGKLFLFLYTILLENPFYRECWMLLSPIYGFNSFVLMKKSDTLYIPTSGAPLGCSIDVKGNQFDFCHRRKSSKACFITNIHCTCFHLFF